MIPPVSEAIAASVLVPPHWFREHVAIREARVLLTSMQRYRISPEADSLRREILGEVEVDETGVGRRDGATFWKATVHTVVPDLPPKEKEG
jgi:hypothetical protein